MITHPVVNCLAQWAARESQSALPDAPVVPDRVSGRPFITASRLRLTATFRRLADALDPAPSPLCCAAKDA
jgi:hypothetical protein